MESTLDANIYAGVSSVTLAVDSYDLGHGVVFSDTFAHLFSTYMVAFAPAKAGRHHPGPWHAAEGGISVDVRVEMRVPTDCSLGGQSQPIDVIWWLAALLRASRYPYLRVPVISSCPFAEARSKGTEAVRLRPYEVEERIIAPANETGTVLDVNDLDWIKERWLQAGRLVFSHKKLHTAFQAFDAATIAGKASSSLLGLWGGLEQLFGYGRFRIASSIAAYLSPPGEERRSTYRKVKKLYDARSAAAHTANETRIEPLLDTYVIMRNALIKIVDECRLPTKEDIEDNLFDVQGSPVPNLSDKC